MCYMKAYQKKVGLTLRLSLQVKKKKESKPKLPQKLKKNKNMLLMWYKCELAH